MAQIKVDNIKQQHRKRWSQRLTYMTSILVTAVSSFLVVFAELNLEMEEIDMLSPFWSIIGVSLGIALVFLGLNIDTYSVSRRDIIPMIIFNLAILIPGILLGFTSHQWGRALSVMGLACVGGVGGWSLSQLIIQQSWYEGKEKIPLAIARQALSGMITLLTMVLYIMLPLLEKEIF